MKKYLYILSFLVTIQSCITIKDSYPDIKFYSLTNDTTKMYSGLKTNRSLLMLNMRISQEIDSRHLIGYNEGKLQRYFYHRWINDLNDLTTDFIINKITESSIFSKGVIKSSSIIIPDLILEGELLDAKSYSNTESKIEKNYVEVSIRFSLLERNSKGAERKQIFTKDYHQKVLRYEEDANTIPIAISKALSQISQKLIDDMNQNLTSDRNK